MAVGGAITMAKRAKKVPNWVLSVLTRRVSASFMSLHCGIVLKRQDFEGGEQAEVQVEGRGTRMCVLEYRRRVCYLQIHKHSSKPMDVKAKCVPSFYVFLICACR